MKKKKLKNVGIRASTYFFKPQNIACSYNIMSQQYGHTKSMFMCKGERARERESEREIERVERIFYDMPSRRPFNYDKSFMITWPPHASSIRYTATLLTQLQ